MKSRIVFGFSLILLGFPAVKPVTAQTSDEALFKQWVNYKDGEVSVAFDQTPVDLALYAIRERTGFQIDIPAPVSETKVINLRLERSPMEPAMRTVISNIGFRNFALMYDDSGKPARAVVLGTSQPAVTEPAAVDTETNETKKLTNNESEKIQRDLERWSELKQEDRGRIEDRLKTIPESEDREKLLKEYARQLLGIKK